MQLSRREALNIMAAAGFAATLNAAEAEPSRVVTRGVVLYPWDLTLDWPQLAAEAGITTIGLHAARRLDVLMDYVRSDRGQRFLADCARLGVAVEYELHALGELLSRELFYSPGIDMFRMDGSGRRNLDANCCPSSEAALEVISERAVEIGRVLKPTTNRYFYWPDDASEWCECPKCKGLSHSDQALLVENAMVEALRKHLNPNATLSHIAYGKTLAPATQVKPHVGLFLEFAPIARVYDRSIGERDAVCGGSGAEPKSHGEYLDLLDANLAVFKPDTAQALEYWLDVSRFSSWTRPAQKLVWNDTVVRADAKAYAKRGIRHITTFATWIDGDYVERFGLPPLKEYVQALQA